MVVVGRGRCRGVPAARGPRLRAGRRASAAATCRRSAPTTARRARRRTAFGALCDRAAAHGLLVGIEWLPYTNIATAADAQAIVEAADRPNGGYCADIWHHRRGANDDSMLRALPGDRVYRGADGRRVRCARSSTTTSRTAWPTGCRRARASSTACSSSDCCSEIGVRAPISLEVCSTELWAAPAAEAADAGGRCDAGRAGRGRPGRWDLGCQRVGVRDVVGTADALGERPGGKASSTCSTLSHSCTTVRWAIFHSPSRRSKRST